MFRVLGTVPGIDQMKLGVSSDQNWIHPYLEYRAVANETGYRQVIRFYTFRACEANNQGSCCSDVGRNYCFTAMLPGLVTPGRMPSDWGTTDLEQKWKSTCGVNATSLFE